MFEQGSPVKCQPLAFWSFADCFAYLDKHGVPAHPLHEQVLLLASPQMPAGPRPPQRSLPVSEEVAACIDVNYATVHGCPCMMLMGLEELLCEVRRGVDL